MICRCENEGVCDFEKQAEGQDLNANGFAVVTCNCSGGWSGDHCDVDYDSCEGTPCFEGVICFDEPPSSDEEYTCGPCPPELSGDGTTCFDFNECADGDTNDCAQNCENNLGSYTCSCNTGYLLALDQRSCDEISGCDEALRISTESDNCTCEPGFQLENRTCSDFDECASDVDRCPPDISTCMNLPGDYNCTCHSGYHNPSPKECQDIDECEQNTHDCNSSADRVCMNTPGSFSCVCGEDTTEINGICQNALTISLSIRLTFISGLSVESYPHTIDSQKNQHQLAQDVLRFLNASSEWGDDTLLAVSVHNYTVIGSYALVSFRVDVEPDASLDDTSLEQIFMELLPGSRLIAPDHQVMQEDINECVLSSDVCRNGNCTNTDGSYYCTCNEGFEGTGNDSCTDINECLGAHNCNQTCLNSPGNYSCSCLLGFELDDDGFTCNEIDECESIPCANGGTCTDGTNMYNCTCAPGYTGINCSTEIPTTQGTPLSTAVESTATKITQPKTPTPQEETDFPSTTSSSTKDSDTAATSSLTTTEENGETMVTRGPKTEGTEDKSTTYKTTTSSPEEQPFESYIRIEITANRRNGNPLEFSEELEDQNSAAFKDLEIIYCGATTSYLNTSLNSPQLTNIKCYVLSFRHGSVIGDLLISIEATSQASADSIGGEAAELSPGNGNYTYLSENLYVAEFASDSTDSCESNPCQNEGTCADGFNTFTCACPTDYTEEDCSRDSGRRGLSPGTIVGVILGAMSGALCFVVCTCCIMLQIVRRKKENKKRNRKAKEYQSENKGIINEECSEPSSDDRSTNFSLDRRHYKISQAVDHFRSYQGMDGRMEETHFYPGAVERNPIHDRYN